MTACKDTWIRTEVSSINAFKLNNLSAHTFNTVSTTFYNANKQYCNCVVRCNIRETIAVATSSSIKPSNTEVYGDLYPNIRFTRAISHRTHQTYVCKIVAENIYIIKTLHRSFSYRVWCACNICTGHTHALSFILFFLNIELQLEMQRFLRYQFCKWSRCYIVQCYIGIYVRRDWQTASMLVIYLFFGRNHFHWPKPTAYLSFLHNKNA